MGGSRSRLVLPPTVCQMVAPAGTKVKGCDPDCPTGFYDMWIVKFDKYKGTFQIPKDDLSLVEEEGTEERRRLSPAHEVLKHVRHRRIVTMERLLDEIRRAQQA